MSGMSICPSTKVKTKVTLIFRLCLVAFFLSACSKDPYDRGVQLYREGNLQEAVSFLEKSCLQSNGDACKLIALIHTSKIINPAKMLQALNLACKYGETSFCFLASRGYEHIKLYPQMAEVLENGCQWGDPDLCFKLGVFYYQGEKLPKNIQKSTELWIKSCYGGKNQACSLAISLLEQNNPNHPYLSDLKRFSQPQR